MADLARNNRNRPQDRLDLGALFATTDDDDLRGARASLQLVMNRGYARGRALGADLDRALAELTREGTRTT